MKKSDGLTLVEWAAAEEAADKLDAECRLIAISVYSLNREEARNRLPRVEQYIKQLKEAIRG